MKSELLRDQSCPNRLCTQFGKTDVKTIKVHDEKRQRLRCAECGKTWRAYRDEVHYGLRIIKPKVERAFEMLAAGLPIRQVAQYTHVSPSTIMRWKKRLEELKNKDNSHHMQVYKFGGTSVGTPDSITQVKNIVIEAHQQSGQLAVVVSAFGGVTDQLIRAAKKAAKGQEEYQQDLQELEQRHLDAIKKLVPVKVQSSVFARIKTLLNELEDALNGVFLLRELTVRSLDVIMSFGERLSSSVIAESLQADGLDAQALDTRPLVKTDENFGYAHVDFEKTNQNIQKHFRDHPDVLFIITGFLGSTNQGETTTLGRGGSDYTSAIFAAALGASEVQIWTDVDGVLTADPRVVKKAFPLPSLSYKEAMEMSHFGAKVIHPPTMRPVTKVGIPIWIRNTFNPSFPGTCISADSGESEHAVKGISSIKEVSLLTLSGSDLVGMRGASRRLFGCLTDSGINIILISQASSEHSICFAVSPDDAKKAKKAIEEEFHFEIQAEQLDPIPIEDDLSVLAIVGEGMKHRTGTSAGLFSALGKNGVSAVAIAQGSSEYNVSVVIQKKHLSKALNAVHDAFFLSGQKTINLFVVGAGLVGSELLRQIQKQQEALETELSLDVRVVGLANSQHMIVDEEGIDLSTWEKSLKKSQEIISVSEFVRNMQDLDLANSIFVDCTASEDVAKQYEEILSSAISVVTPNKKAASGELKQYQKLKALAAKHQVHYLFETNVGAGLPVLSTLKDLMLSGDQVERIEGVLSGTLSYIFNTFDGSKPFSQVVKEAKEKGYTEPDPRDDLNGMDVARKILVLARESGCELEIEDVQLEGLISKACEKAEDVDDFFLKLEKMDDDYQQKAQAAQKEGKVLRYVASLEDCKAKVALQALGPEHPFFSLSGADNMISFTTRRYHDRPLVVKGPGAGAEVTAAGVFADIIRIITFSF